MSRMNFTITCVLMKFSFRVKIASSVRLFSDKFKDVVLWACMILQIDGMTLVMSSSPVIENWQILKKISFYFHFLLSIMKHTRKLPPSIAHNGCRSSSETEESRKCNSSTPEHLTAFEIKFMASSVKRLCSSLISSQNSDLASWQKLSKFSIFALLNCSNSSASHDPSVCTSLTAKYTVNIKSCIGRWLTISSTALQQFWCVMKEHGYNIRTNDNDPREKNRSRNRLDAIRRKYI